MTHNHLYPQKNVWREQFPMLQQTMQGKPLVYLDSAASAQKPTAVLNRVQQFDAKEYSSVHRGVYQLSANATEAYEQARIKAQKFLHAQKSSEIIFTSGTTASINLVAYGFAHLLKSEDEIIISTMEHHANIVPWQVLCQKTGAQLKVINLKSDGTLDLEHYQALLNSRTRLVAITHVSNVTGVINPVRDIITLAHQHNIPVLLDGAQAAPHLPIDVEVLDCDFYTFSSHKNYGPTGVGVLYGKQAWLEKLEPYQTGGNMIRQVTFEKTEYQELPHKFEAGTPNISGVLGLNAAFDFLTEVTMDSILAHETTLTNYTLQRLQDINGLKLIGPTIALHRIGVFSFILKQAHAHDVGTILDSEGIAVRVGHHCAMPLMAFFKVPATVRVSLGLYNNEADIDNLCAGLIKAIKLFE